MKSHILLLIFSITIAKPAFAYLDPGSASLAIQAVLAVIAGGLATMKFWWSKFTSFFKKSTPSREKKK